MTDAILYFVAGCVWGWIGTKAYQRWTRRRLIKKLAGPAETCICPSGWPAGDTRAYCSCYDTETGEFVYEDVTDEMFTRSP